MFGEVLERFVQHSPVAVMVRVLLENLLNPDKLDRWFDTVRQAQYTKEILFSSIVGLMLRVVCNLRPSVHSAYRHSDIRASVVAVYDKLKHMEPTTSQDLVRQIATDAEEIIHNIGGENPPLLPGYRVKFLDGNALAATEHRLEVLRQTRAGALPGKTLVVFDPQLGIATDVFPCEDGHAQERSLLSAVVERVQPQELYIADRNFCVVEFLAKLHQKAAFFIIRQHGNTPYKPLTSLRFIGKSATGEVSEQRVTLTAPTGETLEVRRVVVTLTTPTRNGDQHVMLLTNLPATVGSLTVAGLYRARWGIENAFQKLEAHLHSEINTLGYPKAALFSFCLALVAFNLYAIVMAALRATHPDQAINDIVSEYYIGQEVETTTEGMLIAIPDSEWTMMAHVSATELGPILLYIAAHADLKKYKKNPRGPKKPLMKRDQFKGHPHVSTAKLLKGITPKVVATKAT